MHLVLGGDLVASGNGADESAGLGPSLAKHSEAAFMTPNNDGQLPLHLARAWRSRGIFIPNNVYTRLMTVLPLIFEFVVMMSSAVIASEHQKKYKSILFATCFVVIIILRSLCFSMDQWKHPVKVYHKDKSKYLNVVLVWFQLFVPILSILQGSKRLDENAYSTLLWMRRMSIPITIFPVGVTCTASEIMLGHGPGPLGVICLCCCVAVLGIYGVEQDSYRFFDDKRLPWLRLAEIVHTMCFRGVESLQRITTYALVIAACGGGGICVAMVSEIMVSMLLSSQLLLLLKCPSENFPLLRREMFDLSGTFHGYGLLQSGFNLEPEHEIFGTATIKDALQKIVVKTFSHAIMLIVSSIKLGSEPKKWFAIVVLNACAFVLMGIFFHFRVRIGRKREENMKGLTRIAVMDAKSIQLFAHVSTEFLQSLNDELISCHYAPGDFICRKGEKDSVLHLIINGVASTGLSPFQRKKIRKKEKISSPITSVAHSNSLGSSSVFSTSSKKAVLEERKASDAEHLNEFSMYFKTVDGVLKNRGFNLETKNMQSVFSERMNEYCVLQGSCVGAPGLLSNARRDHNVIARTVCETKALSRASLFKVLTRFPDEIEHIEEAWDMLDDFDKISVVDIDLLTAADPASLHHPSQVVFTLLQLMLLLLLVLVLVLLMFLLLLSPLVLFALLLLLLLTWGMVWQSPSIKRGSPKKAINKKTGGILLHLDLNNIFFDADLQNIFEALTYELSQLLCIPGRNMRLSLHTCLPEQLEILLELAGNDSAVENFVGREFTTQKIFEQIDGIIQSQGVKLLSYIWARRIFEVSFTKEETLENDE